MSVVLILFFMVTFSEKDYAFITSRGSVIADVQKQFSYFISGFDFVNLDRIATIDDGIKKMNKEEIAHYIDIYRLHSPQKKIVKFVPASGAASRMFKELFSFLDDTDGTLPEKISLFLRNLEQFAFFDDLKSSYEKNGKSLKSDLIHGKGREVIDFLLNEQGLNYGNLPKALLQFHQYSNGSRTSLEEQLVEAANYAVCRDNVCYVHFTCSPQHLVLFKDKVAKVKKLYEERYGVKFMVDFSSQDMATDTLSASLDNTPFRDDNGNLLFRPAGHGALINNVNAIDADIVFIKNIDNVISEPNLNDTVIYKMVLAGYLLELQTKIFDYQKCCASGNVDSKLMEEMILFVKDELSVTFETDTPSVEEIYKKLHRPIRICGMVKNEGAPGGGPFWVLDDKGMTSCQIVESSQIDMKNDHQKEIFEKSTHFNPVDLVCGVKDYKGVSYNLNDFVDHRTGFISEKSYSGKILKAMELPGLWNGSMANWITLFVEVPITTFNPAKTVFDLLDR